MKLNNLNLGTPLTKNELKKINGGCPVGAFAQCICGDNTTSIIPGDDSSGSDGQCEAAGACDGHSGLVNSNCESN